MSVEYVDRVLEDLETDRTGLARMLGLTPSAVSHWMSRETDGPSAPVRQEIARLVARKRAKEELTGASAEACPLPVDHRHSDAVEFLTHAETCPACLAKAAKTLSMRGTVR